MTGQLKVGSGLSPSSSESLRRSCLVPPPPLELSVFCICRRREIDGTTVWATVMGCLLLVVLLSSTLYT